MTQYIIVEHPNNVYLVVSLPSDMRKLFCIYFDSIDYRLPRKQGPGSPPGLLPRLRRIQNLLGRTMSGGHRFCADRSGSEEVPNPYVQNLRFGCASLADAY